MKMVMSIVPRDQANHVLEALVRARFTATFSSSRGGMLRQAQEMLFIAVEDDDLESVLSIIRENCRTEVTVDTVDEHSLGPIPVTTELGGAVCFIWDIDRIETY
jgi:uncharacterized protein YaaQ